MSVKEFYNSDEYSRQVPGAKDYKNIGKKLHVSKRHVLCNLHELYSAFKKKIDLKVGFSKFASLVPKWCIVAGAVGTHSVCVCTAHQNIKLDKFYHELTEMIVCSRENKVCMVRRCQKFLGKTSKPYWCLICRFWWHWGNSKLVTHNLLNLSLKKIQRKMP